MRDRKDIIEKFSVGEAAASGRVSCFRGHGWVDLKERKGIEDWFQRSGNGIRQELPGNECHNETFCRDPIYRQ